jgi:hypothetical protein
MEATPALCTAHPGFTDGDLGVTETNTLRQDRHSMANKRLSLVILLADIAVRCYSSQVLGWKTPPTVSLSSTLILTGYTILPSIEKKVRVPVWWRSLRPQNGGYIPMLCSRIRITRENKPWSKPCFSSHSKENKPTLQWHSEFQSQYFVTRLLTQPATQRLLEFESARSNLVDYVMSYD